MKWKGRRQSTNVEDMRATPARGIAIGGGPGGAGILVVAILLLFTFCSGGKIGGVSHVIKLEETLLS
jgi:predicted metalloprotease